MDAIGGGALILNNNNKIIEFNALVGDYAILLTTQDNYGASNQIEIVINVEEAIN